MITTDQLTDVFLIHDVKDYAPQVGILVSMMNYARYTTLQLTNGLTTAQLDYKIDEDSNTIGMLLYHIASVERIYQLLTFEHRAPTLEEDRNVLLGLELDDEARQEIKGHSLSYYVDYLHNTRKQTLTYLQTIDEDWLFASGELWGQPTNNYFKWFYVMENEMSHRGQMSMILEKLQKR
ncbi:hypothetical protein A374_16523 [Fictibacillus macauensis ZFHKF-1]|uniref:DinB family protein n=1 Tax=Fictibacillus macauensis ZFHKF-1 TaxID=1196324 RepID=I8IXL1_9BACL|nr:DinB family protein [Fictibacillus macauensis]EIT84226.1 hypothetical protein A374_16523 [Fictibacillus macauensis ZFHKF-1]